MKPVLFISHFFPPTGGAGVQRSAKFVKYLPHFGWQPIVLTSAPASSDRWAPKDESLAEEVAPDTAVIRVDKPRVSANSAAAAADRLAAMRSAGAAAIQKFRPALIFVTMSPFGDAAVARQLAEDHQLPWIADLRDPWALDEFQVYRSRWHRMRERRRMARALSSASSIILNTPEARSRLRSLLPSLAAKAETSITNGYDAAEFDVPIEPRRQQELFTIVHSGYFHADLGLRQRRRSLEYRLLGRTLPGVEFLSRSHYYLLQALRAAGERNPLLLQQTRVVCLGSASACDQELVQQAHLEGVFEFTGYRPHNECLNYVRSADLLFLPMHHLPADCRATIVPGKTYEYMASGRPILAAVPHGDARDFLARAGSACICDPKDVPGMARALQAQFDRWKTGEAPPACDSDYVRTFERRVLTARLADVFDDVIQHRGPSLRSRELN